MTNLPSFRYSHPGRHGSGAVAKATALVAGLTLCGALLVGCGGGGTDVNCSLNDCTVTFDRGVDASTSVLGVDVKLKSVKDGQVTLDIEGNELQVPVGGDAQAESGGLQFQVDSVTDSQVVVKISR